MSIIVTDLIKEQAATCLVMASAGIVFSTFYQLCSFFFQEGDRQKMDPGRAGAFFLGDSGSYDVPIFILLRLWKPELPCGGGIRGRGFVVETLVL